MLSIPSLRQRLTLAVSSALGIAALAATLRGSWRHANQLGMAASAVLLAPTLIRNCSWNGQVTTRFSTKQKEIWLTIDDGPDPNDTPQLLELLKRHGVRATFFVIGRNVAKWPQLARDIKLAGHDLQNHSNTHPAFTFWAATPARARCEIAAGSQAIFQAAEIWPTLFRAPAGLANPFVHSAAEKAGLRMIGWSATGHDGVPHDPPTVIKKILRNIRPGAIILLHEGPAKNLPRGTRAKTLDTVLSELEKRDYRAVIPAT